ncbi:MAG: hypothetical protein O2840_03040 [bacterium]|nr:hypothetical protein [bacterium]
MQQPPQPHWIFARWYHTLAVSAFVLLLAAVVLQTITPKPKTPSSTLGDIQPGENFSKKMQQELGEPLETFTTKSGDEGYLYSSSFAAHPNQVHVDEENKIVFVKEYLTFDPNHTLAQYVTEYGQPDFALYDSESPETTRSHVFLTAGLVVVAHVDGDVVEQKWFFVPTTKDAFLAGYGSSLSEFGHGPESLGSE